MQFSNEKSPLVSVIINCHNGETYLNEALNSIEKQKYKNYEVIFFDNNSSDNSAKIFNNFKNKKFKYYRSNKKLNLYKARNLALEKCKGQLITFLDTDDFWLENKLLLQVRLFEKEQPDLIYSSYYISNSNLEKKKIVNMKFKDNYEKNFLIKYEVALVTLAIRRNLLIDSNIKFNENYNVIGDFDLVMKIAKYYKISKLNEPTAIYRQHKNNYTILNFNELICELKNWSNINKTDISRDKIKHLNNKIIYYETINELNKGNFKNFFYKVFLIFFTNYFAKSLYHLFLKLLKK